MARSRRVYAPPRFLMAQAATTPPPFARHRLPAVRAAAVVGVLLAGCQADPFTRWAPGDALFESDPRFMGGDSAYSVDLGDDRILWLFGDTFVGPATGEARQGLPMARNSVAIQTGRDPMSAGMKFEVGSEPFFAANRAGAEQSWLWPGPGMLIGDTLVVGLTEIRSTPTGLGFETASSKLAFIEQPGRPAALWEPEITDAPPSVLGAQLSLGAWFNDGGQTFLFAPIEPGDHSLLLARWDDAQVVAERIPTLSWWTGSTWSTDERQAHTIVPAVQTELSVHREGSELWMVSVDGFGASNIVVRTAVVPEGPWSAPRRLLRPPEAARDDILIYSAKAHPALRSSGASTPLMTYCTNHTDFGTLATDMRLYFPRFVAPRRPSSD